MVLNSSNIEFKRTQSIEKELYPRRALIVYGPRRVGKTTLLESYLKQQQHAKILYVQGDDYRIREIFSQEYRENLLRLARDYDIVAIDEVQQIPSIGMGIKMIIDAMPEKTIILTGSSSFEPAGQVGEPLVGRHFTMTLLPIAQSEILLGQFELREKLEDFLIYGSYPEIIKADSDRLRQKLLTELVSSYLYKDVLALDKIKNPILLDKIAKMIALQIGSEVSLNEIAVALNSDVKTVERYLDLLEKMFIIKKVYGFSRNLRNEITKKARYYFLDNGVRNAVIRQFQLLSLRVDHGALWENFIFMELFKRDNIAGTLSRFYFWRTHSGSEIDIVREYNGQIDAFECKWSPRKAKTNPPKPFARAYPEATFATITPENYLDFLTSQG